MILAIKLYNRYIFCRDAGKDKPSGTESQGKRVCITDMDLTHDNKHSQQINNKIFLDL